MENADGAPAKRWGLGKVLLWIAGIGIVSSVVLTSLGNTANPGSSVSNTANTASADNSNSVQSTTSASNVPVQSGPSSSFGDGTFIVNNDIQPGTYKNSGGDSCYYARLKGFGGTVGDIIANDNTN